MKKLFWFAAILRILSVFPLVIDDDEAWWSASALALKTPWEFYHKAIDNKPPGTVWFYWLSGHLLPVGADPRIARAAYVTVTVFAAWLLSLMARKMKN